MDIATKYTLWKARNPHVIKLFRQLAYKLKQNGATRLSGKHIAEVMRMEHAFGVSGSVYKIDNNFISFLVSDLIADEPSFGLLFVRKKKRDLQQEIF